MNSYYFKLRLEGPLDPDELEAKAVAADCTDGLVGGYPDVPFIELERDGQSLLEAVTAAIRDVHNAGLQVGAIEHTSPECAALDSAFQLVKSVPDATQRLLMIEQLATV